jgi:DNA-binding GntR family transcriptional regulator
MGVRHLREERRPLYRQVADALHQKITEGAYPPGALLPSLPELRAQHRVADLTARHALEWLEHRGIIAVRHGKRAVVLEPQIDPSDSYGKLFAEIAALTRRMDSVVDLLEDLAATIHGHKQPTRSRARRSS